MGVALNDKELLRMRDLAEFIKSEIEADHQPSLWPAEEMAMMAIECRRKLEEDDRPINVNLKKLREEQRVTVGIHEVYGKLYQELGLDKVSVNPKRYKHDAKLLHHIVMARIANPSSKRAAVAMLERDSGINLPLEKVYRMMDKLDDQAIERLQNIAGNATHRVLGEKINVLFYDCTTLYFESFTEDELKQNGYSKDGKFNQAQVILAMLCTESGLPVGYEVFPGASFEWHTLIPILKQLKKRYELNQVAFVADRGMLSEDNLYYLEQEGLSYIVGARLRNLSKNMQQQILDASNYKILGDGEGSDRLGIFEQRNDRKLIVHYSGVRARKDAHDREKAIDKLLKKLGKNKKDPKSLLGNYGYKKYLTITGDTKLGINEEKVEAEIKWDGLHGVITNTKDIEPNFILSHYRGLWQIEECFRINKHDLKIRPIYHWTPKRIRAHLAIAFMSFTCMRHLEYRVSLQHKKLSPEVIRRELAHVQLSLLKHQQTGKRYCVPSNVSLDAKKIYQAMGLKLSTTSFELPTDG